MAVIAVPLGALVAGAFVWWSIRESTRKVVLVHQYAPPPCQTSAIPPMYQPPPPEYKTVEDDMFDSALLQPSPSPSPIDD